MTDQAYNVSMKDTAFNYVVTILCGSLVLVSVSDWLHSMTGSAADFFGLFLLAFMISGTAGVPLWMLLMLLVYKLNEHQWSYRKFLWIFHGVYLGGSALYFFIWLEDKGITRFTLEVIASFTLSGLATWNLFFFLHRRKLQKTSADA